MVDEQESGWHDAECTTAQSHLRHQKATLGSKRTRLCVDRSVRDRLPLDETGQRNGAGPFPPAGAVDYLQVGSPSPAVVITGFVVPYPTPQVTPASCECVTVAYQLP